ncbi:hypothetical protein QH494_25930 [Sphingomonas sp. AR_OL41]|uniref:hypothetical protein n=1 Tax=Sphingomonas sp. AR_OL41 TaxID=3042729 RepID=UPI00248002DD|nr:hypothetical protein [Sphingomonas sp. AR_OL41]MDH7975639.1 hypothetical protein [Sphingomonas sp. AR_OL41]
MIRRILIAFAFIGVAGSFASAIRDLHRFADRFCGPAEAGGNCRAIARYFALNDILMFAAFAVLLAILLLIPFFKSTGK